MFKLDDINVYYIHVILYYYQVIYRIINNSIEEIKVVYSVYYLINITVILYMFTSNN